MELSEVAKQLASLESEVNVDLVGSDPRTLMGKETRKRMAKQELEVVVNQYNSLVLNHFVKVFITGDLEKVQEFLSSASKAGALVADGRALYEQLATPVDKTLDPRNRYFTAGQMVRLIQEMADLGREYEMRSMMMPRLDGSDYSTSIPTFSDTVNLVKKAIRNTLEDDLNKFYLERDILTKARAARASDKIIPVLIGNLTESEITGLSQCLFNGRPNIVVNLNEVNHDDNFITNCMRKIGEMYNALNKNGE